MYKGVKLPSEHISNFISQDKLTQVLGAGALSSRKNLSFKDFKTSKIIDVKTKEIKFIVQSTVALFLKRKALLSKLLKLNIKNGNITRNCYEAMINYEVEIDD